MKETGSCAFLKDLFSMADFFSTLRMVYFALCQSIMSFGITIWGEAPKPNTLQLERAQSIFLKKKLMYLAGVRGF